MTFDIINDGAAVASVNMDRDRELFESCEKDPRKLVRFYGWQESAVTYGCNQRLSDVKKIIRENQWTIDSAEIVHRPTGGGVVYHGPSQLTYSLFLPLQEYRTENLLSMYRQISMKIITVLKRLGIPAHLVSVNREQFSQRRIDPVCQDFSAKYEILSGGEKIVGAAQKKGKHALLQQTAFFIPVHDRNQFKELFIRELETLR